MFSFNQLRVTKPLLPVLTMAPVTNLMLNETREKECIGVTTERKYFRTGQAWVKRSLRPSEWQINPFAGTLFVPRFGMKRILNEAAAMQFIAEKTDIPVPKVYSCFEDDKAAYLVMEYVEGVTMNELGPDERKVVERELEHYLKTLRELRSPTWGGPSGIVSTALPRAIPYFFTFSNIDMNIGYPTLSCHGSISSPRVENEDKGVGGSRLLPQRSFRTQRTIFSSPRTICCT